MGETVVIEDRLSQTFMCMQKRWNDVSTIDLTKLVMSFPSPGEGVTHIA